MKNNTSPQLPPPHILAARKDVGLKIREMRKRRKW